MEMISNQAALHIQRSMYIHVGHNGVHMKSGKVDGGQDKPLQLSSEDTSCSTQGIFVLYQKRFQAIVIG